MPPPGAARPPPVGALLTLAESGEGIRQVAQSYHRHGIVADRIGRLQCSICLDHRLLIASHHTQGMRSCRQSPRGGPVPYRLGVGQRLVGDVQRGHVISDAACLEVGQLAEGFDDHVVVEVETVVDDLLAPAHPFDWSGLNSEEQRAPTQVCQLAPAALIDAPGGAGSEILELEAQDGESAQVVPTGQTGGVSSPPDPRRIVRGSRAATRSRLTRPADRRRTGATFPTGGSGPLLDRTGRATGPPS